MAAELTLEALLEAVRRGIEHAGARPAGHVLKFYGVPADDLMRRALEGGPLKIEVHSIPEGIGDMLAAEVNHSPQLPTAGAAYWNPE